MDDVGIGWRRRWRALGRPSMRALAVPGGSARALVRSALHRPGGAQRTGPLRLFVETARELAAKRA